MKFNKKLIISFIGIVVFFTIIFSGDCSSSIRNMRGNAAIFYGLFLALGGAVSIIYFVVLYLTSSTQENKVYKFFNLLVIFPLFILIFRNTLHYFFFNLCVR